MRSLTTAFLAGITVVVLAQPVRQPAMVEIAGGTFQIGSSQEAIDALRAALPRVPAEVFDAERPRHAVTLAVYRIDAFEVTRGDFAEFLAQHPEWRRDRLDPPRRNENYLRGWTDDVPPAGTEKLPVVDVTWHAAVAFCGWRGARLPSEAEWEHAAAGGLDAPVYPWGDAAPDPSRANFIRSSIGGAVPVGSYAANGYGLFDMAGNVWEFVADEWAPYSAAVPAALDVLASQESLFAITTRRVIRGGSWGGAPINLRVSYRDSHPPLNATDFVGFRCATSAD